MYRKDEPKRVVKTSLTDNVCLLLSPENYSVHTETPETVYPSGHVKLISGWEVYSTGTGWRQVVMWYPGLARWYRIGTVARVHRWAWVLCLAWVLWLAWPCTCTDPAWPLYRYWSSLATVQVLLASLATFLVLLAQPGSSLTLAQPGSSRTMAQRSSH